METSCVYHPCRIKTHNNLQLGTIAAGLMECGLILCWEKERWDRGSRAKRVLFICFIHHVCIDEYCGTWSSVLRIQLPSLRMSEPSEGVATNL